MFLVRHVLYRIVEKDKMYFSSFCLDRIHQNDILGIGDCIAFMHILEVFFCLICFILLFLGKAVLEVTLPSPVLAVRYNLFPYGERGGGGSSPRPNYRLNPKSC